MRATQHGLSHTFLRLGFLIVVMSMLITPITVVFGQFEGDGTTTGTGGTPNVVPATGDGGFEGDGTTTGTGGTSGGGGTTDPITGADGASDGADSGGETTGDTESTDISSVANLNLINANTDERAYGIMISLGGWIAGLGGNLFEISFDHFVLGMGCYFNRNGGEDCNNTRISAAGQIGGVVDELWVIIRDLFNLALIFSIVLIGFKMILNADDSGTRRALGYLILAALLVNFSLYLAKVVVDVANFTATTIYGQMVAPPPSGSGGGFAIGEGAGAFSLAAGNQMAGVFMQVLAVPSWFQPQGNVANTWTFAIMALIFLIFLGAIFVYGAFMMMARFIAIVILLIFSPLMFIGWVLPSFASYSSKWRKMFVSYAFFAPLFVFMLYLSLYSLLSLSTILGVTSGGYASAFADNGTMAAGRMNIFVYFFVGAGFLFASTKVAGIMADAGAGASMNMASSFAKRISTGAAAAGGGYMATGIMGLGGKKLTDIADAAEARTGRSSIFTRNTRALGEATKNKKIAGVNSTATIKGFTDRAAAADKNANTLKTSRDFTQTIESIAPKIDNRTATDAEKIKFETAVAGASDADIVALAKTTSGLAALKLSAGSLKESQVQALLKSEDISPEDRKAFLSTRQESVKKKVQGTSASFGDGLKNATVAQLTSVDFTDDLLPNAMYLQESQMDELKKKWDDNETFKILKQKREADIKAAPVSDVIDSRKNKTEIAKLPADVLKKKDAVQYLQTKGMLDNDMLDAISKDAPALNKQEFGQEVLDLYGAGLDLSKAPQWVQKYFTSSNGAKFLPDNTVV